MKIRIQPLNIKNTLANSCHFRSHKSTTPVFVVQRESPDSYFQLSAPDRQVVFFRNFQFPIAAGKCRSYVVKCRSVVITPHMLDYSGRDPVRNNGALGARRLEPLGTRET
jgi:hypothetical protein